MAANLPTNHRQHLAIQALVPTEPVSRMAARESVSRQFIYCQKRTAEMPLNLAFAPVPADSAVLFYLLVTAAWLGLDQLAVSLVLMCHNCRQFLGPATQHAPYLYSNVENHALWAWSE